MRDLTILHVVPDHCLSFNFLSFALGSRGKGAMQSSMLLLIIAANCFYTTVGRKISRTDSIQSLISSKASSGKKGQHKIRRHQRHHQ